MKLHKAINWIAYNGFGQWCKPSNSISDARWRAMVAHILREYFGQEPIEF